VVDEKPVEQRFAEFMMAMNAQDWSGAQQQLDALRKRLPPQAAGLLRAQAWFDLQRGEVDLARQGYQQLLERLPGDEEAAINLASVLSRQGQGEAARQVLLQAVQIRPDAPRLRDALRRFTPEVRP
jgi:Flp pilus assembly protein TadD